MPNKKKFPVYQLKATLRGVRPPIWRRFLVSSDMKLSVLHEVVQALMDWYDCHLHDFEIGGIVYGDPDVLDSLDADEKKVKLSNVIRGVQSKFDYEYDFGDGWIVSILLEKVLPPGEGSEYPVCLKGKRAAPPEDCGGVWGYEELLEKLHTPGERDEVLEWLCADDFDPEAFDVDDVNAFFKQHFSKAEKV